MDTLISNSIPLAKCTPPQTYHAIPNTKHQRNCSRYSFANLLTCRLFRSLAEFSLDLSALSYKLAIHFNIFVQLGLQAALSNLIRPIHIDPIPSTLHIYLATKTGSFSPASSAATVSRCCCSSLLSQEQSTGKRAVAVEIIVSCQLEKDMTTYGPYDRILSPAGLALHPPHCFDGGIYHGDAVMLSPPKAHSPD